MFVKCSEHRSRQKFRRREKACHTCDLERFQGIQTLEDCWCKAGIWGLQRRRAMVAADTNPLQALQTLQNIRCFLGARCRIPSEPQYLKVFEAEEVGER